MSAEIIKLGKKPKPATPGYHRRRKAPPISERNLQLLELEGNLMRLTRDLDFLTREFGQFVFRFMNWRAAGE